MSQPVKSGSKPLANKSMPRSSLAKIRGRADGFLIALSFAIFVLSFFFIGSSFGFIAGKSLYYKTAFALIGTALSVFCLYLTSHWDYLVDLFWGARIELNKVHWPSKDEWSKSTLMVLLLVSIFSILLMFIDWIIALLIKLVL